MQYGDPPSASEAVDIAKVNKIAATNNRATFFMFVSPSIKSEVLVAGKTVRAFWENGTHVRKARDSSCANRAGYVGSVFGAGLHSGEIGELVTDPEPRRR